MAKIANTFVSTDAVGNREELSDVVDRVQRDKTPFYSMISKGSAMSTYPEWERDEIAAPAENIQPEGNEYNFDAITPAERMGNPTQIFSKTFIMSRTQDAVSNAGRAEQFKRKKLDKALEIKRDVELACFTNNASVRGETRELGGLPTWLESNVSRGAGAGANGGFNSSTGLTVAATNGDQRTFTKTLLDDTMQTAWTNGASVDTVMLSPYAKRVFTTFTTASGVVPLQMNSGSGGDTVKANATIYDGDFGRLTVVPNYILGLTTELARNVYLLDTNKLSFKWLKGRKIHEDTDLAKTGDSKKHALVGEGTLCVTNEKGLGAVTDIYGATAST